MTGPRQDNATLTEELLAAADELERKCGLRDCGAGGRTKCEPMRQAALVRALVAEHGEHQAALSGGRTVCGSWPGVGPHIPCPTFAAVADCFLSSGSTVPGVTK